MSAPVTRELPPPAALQEVLQGSTSAKDDSPHPAYLGHLATTVAHDLQFQHDWTNIVIHKHSTITQNLLPRPVISGLPPRKAYVHPDEQIEILKAEHATGKSVERVPEREWVLPTHLQEKWSLAKFAAVFDALEPVPEGENATEIEEEEDEEELPAAGSQWLGNNRQKRLLLATLHNDSTIVYYIMHDGIVKPRQN